MRRLVFPALALAALMPCAEAQTFANPVRFQEQEGAALYQNICQGCHMPDGKGARGAGAFPALARDARLGEAGYPVLVVLQGRKGMPGFAAMLSDAQVAAVVTYVRTHFGNDFTAAVGPDDVKAARKP